MQISGAIIRTLHNTKYLGPDATYFVRIFRLLTPYPLTFACFTLLCSSYNFLLFVASLFCFSFSFLLRHTLLSSCRLPSCRFSLGFVRSAPVLVPTRLLGSPQLPWWALATPVQFRVTLRRCLGIRRRTGPSQAASGGSAKRSGPAPPAFPRPHLRRGDPLIQDTNYASMERPAPTTPAPNVLYVDMRNSSLSPEEVLEAAFPVLGNHVIGFQLFAAQKTLGLVFTSAESCTLHRNKTIGETGLTLYPAPAKPVNLLKLTLQGVPFWDTAGVVATLPSILKPYGDLVFLAPMVTASGWTSDQWHATISRAPDNMALPPETIEILGQPVIVDIPAQRRYCRHCESSIHVKPSCRQGARQRQRQQQLAKDAAAVATARAQRLQPPSHDSQQPHPPDQQPPLHQTPLSHQPPQPTSHQHQQRVPPENWEDQADDMDATPTGEMSLEERVRRATYVVSAYASDPRSFDVEIYEAARQFLDDHLQTGSADQ